jgi:exodeoxyribonuclease V gamma subunit
VLLESLLSARQHLLISWSSRDERTGEALEASTPVRQWLDLLAAQLDGPLPLRQHAANPLERRNFRSDPPWPAASCDRRLLQARRQLEQEPVAPVRGLALRESSATSSSGAGEPATPEQAWSDLRAWLEAPQASWLESLGLRPREWHQPVRDLEDLHLDERQRSALLRAQLDDDGLPTSEELPDWPLLERGRGRLPPLAAGTLEVRQLEQRIESLQQCLELLGPRQRRPVSWQGLSATLHWRGNGLALAHTGKPRSRQRLRLWMELLLAAAAGETPTGAALVGRDGDRLRVLERLDAPSAAQAATVLEQLRQWRAHHQDRCWPLPPDTGWAYAKGELASPGTGKGWRDARNSWEGSFTGRGERHEAVQALCFGSDLPLAELLTPAVQELALALHEPLLAGHRVVKP